MRPLPVRSRCDTRRARGTAINWQGDSSVTGLSAAGLREHDEADERIISSFFIVHGDDKSVDGLEGAERSRRGRLRNSLMLSITFGLENPQVMHPSPITGKGMSQSGQLR